MADVDYETIGWIAASTQRLTVAEHLTTEGPSTPSTIAEETGITLSHVSLSLGKLRDKGLVKLLVPEETRKGRIYGSADGLERIVEAANDV